MTGTLVVRGSRLSSLMFTLLCLGAVGIGFLPNVVWFGGGPGFVQAAFGLGAVVGLIGTVAPARLVLHPDRFDYPTLFGRRTVAWNQMEDLFYWRRGVGWRLRRADPALDVVDRFIRVAMVDGWINGGWALSPGELLDVMEDYRRTASAD